MTDLYISWPEYHQKIEQLAAQIYIDGWQFNQIVCLARGGLRIGDLLSRIYRQPLAILAVSSYGGMTGQERGAIAIAQHLTMTRPGLGSHVLLVDDLVDSGVSMQEAIAWLNRYHGEKIQEIRTAVLWCKACSAYQPDYFVDYLKDNPWIHQPFEGYETLTASELAAVELGKGSDSSREQ
jgi:hypoxanthine phosphoribosyltransferase